MLMNEWNYMIPTKANLWHAISLVVGPGIGFIIFTDSFIDLNASTPKLSSWRCEIDISAIPALLQLTKTLTWLKQDWIYKTPALSALVKVIFLNRMSF